MVTQASGHARSDSQRLVDSGEKTEALPKEPQRSSLMNTSQALSFRASLIGEESASGQQTAHSSRHTAALRIL